MKMGAGELPISGKGWKVLAQGLEYSDYLSYAAGGLGQLLMWLAIGMHLLASNRNGRFTVSPGMVALGLVGASFVSVYAIMRQDWLLLAGQPVAFIIGIRLLSLCKPEEPASKGFEAPSSRLPVVAPDSAEIKISSIRDAGPRAAK